MRTGTVSLFSEFYMMTPSSNQKEELVEHLTPEAFFNPHQQISEFVSGDISKC